MTKRIVSHSTLEERPLKRDIAVVGVLVGDVISAILAEHFQKADKSSGEWFLCKACIICDGGTFSGFAQCRIRQNHIGDGGDFEFLSDGEGPHGDLITSVWSDDGSTNDAAIFLGDDFDESFGFAFGEGAIIFLEVPAQHTDGFTMLLSRVFFGEADVGQFGVGVGDPGNDVGAVLDGQAKQCVPDDQACVIASDMGELQAACGVTRCINALVGCAQ
jgi:hypothetical protein